MSQAQLKLTGPSDKHIPLNPQAIPRAQQAAVIRDMSLMCGAGEDLLKVAAAVNAGIDVYRQDTWVNRYKKGGRSAFIPEQALPALKPEVAQRPFNDARMNRMLRILTKPLQALAGSLTEAEPVALIIAVPEAQQCIHSWFDKTFLSLLRFQTGINFDLKQCQIIRYGRSAGLIAVNQALLKLQQQPAMPVIVGGVDTFMDARHLACLDAQERLLGEGVMDGFVPGEGASFLLLNTVSQNVAGQVILHPLGIGAEAGHRHQPEEVYKGEGLAAAVQEALGYARSGAIEQTWCSLNGEHFGNKEWGVSYMRNSEYFNDAMQLYHPAEFFGDLGAAAGTSLIALAALQLKQQAADTQSLVWCSSELEARAAIVLSKDGAA